jgi:hypothetical protein
MTETVKVYVKSEKVAVGVGELHERIPAGVEASTTVDNVTRVLQYDYFLSDDQKSQLFMIKEVCQERGYDVEVIDVTKEGLLKKLIDLGISQNDRFPIVVAPNGRRIVGEELSRVWLEQALPADMNGKEIRGFVYIRVKKGFEEKLRQKLLDLPEVREVHLIPGEWDAFAVVGLPAAQGSSERLMLDYVMTNIRTIDWVDSTSTIVPVYSYTKFSLLVSHKNRTG